MGFTYYSNELLQFTQWARQYSTYQVKRQFICTLQKLKIFSLCRRLPRPLYSDLRLDGKMRVAKECSHYYNMPWFLGWFGVAIHHVAAELTIGKYPQSVPPTMYQAKN
jgi:hypothetical protein